MSCPFGLGGTGPSRRALMAGTVGLLASAGVSKFARAAAEGTSTGAAPQEAFLASIREALRPRNRQTALSSPSTSSPSRAKR